MMVAYQQGGVEAGGGTLPAHSCEGSLLARPWQPPGPGLHMASMKMLTVLVQWLHGTVKDLVAARL